MIQHLKDEASDLRQEMLVKKTAETHQHLRTDLNVDSRAHHESVD